MNDAVRNVYERWHALAKSRDVEGLLALCAHQAVFESPLVPATLDLDDGVLHGHAQIRPFLEEGTRRRPNELVRWYRDGTYLTDGRRLTWEYPRRTPDGDQIDILEVMDIEDGLIANHRIYWGWFGCRQLIQSALRRSGPSTAP